MRKKTNKQLTKELQNLPAVIKPLTRGELLIQRSKDLQEGLITIYEFGQELKLTDQQIRFAELYADTAHLGNGREAAIIAYDIDMTQKKATQKADGIAGRLKKHQGVITLINVLLSNNGYSVLDAKKALGFLVNQFADLKMKGIAAKTIMEAEGMLKKDQVISVKHSFDPEVFSISELLELKKKILKGRGENESEIIDIIPID